MIRREQHCRWLAARCPVLLAAAWAAGNRPGHENLVPGARPLSSEAERVHLVVVEYRGATAEAQRAAVSGAPVDAAADDRGAAGYRAAAGKAPQDLPGRGFQGVHVVADG